MLVQLSKRYRDQVVFENFKMSIESGKIHSVLGPSGCGKSTLLKCISGLESYEGIIEIDHTNLSYVFQEDRLFPWFSVYKNLKIINDDEELIDMYLRQFDLYSLKNKYPSQLSGGEKQRISIIRAFIYDQPLVLLDEPFKSLDYNLKWDIVKMLAELQKEERKTILLITHDLDVALYLSDVITVFSKKPTAIKLQIENEGKENLTSEVSIKNRLQIMNEL